MFSVALRTDRNRIVYNFPVPGTLQSGQLSRRRLKGWVGDSITSRDFRFTKSGSKPRQTVVTLQRHLDRGRPKKRQHTLKVLVVVKYG